MQITANESTVIVAGAGYVASAAISTMPPKDCEWNAKTLYGWFFDFCHMLLNMRRPMPDAAKQQLSAS